MSERCTYIVNGEWCARFKGHKGSCDPVEITKGELVAKVVRTLDLGLPLHHSRGCTCIICQNRDELIAMVTPPSGIGPGREDAISVPEYGEKRRYL